jgi:hypothetical protein
MKTSDLLGPALDYRGRTSPRSLAIMLQMKLSNREAGNVFGGK